MYIRVPVGPTGAEIDTAAKFFHDLGSLHANFDGAVRVHFVLYPGGAGDAAGRFAGQVGRSLVKAFTKSSSGHVN